MAFIQKRTEKADNLPTRQHTEVPVAVCGAHPSTGFSCILDTRFNIRGVIDVYSLPRFSQQYDVDNFLHVYIALFMRSCQIQALIVPDIQFYGTLLLKLAVSFFFF